MEPKLRNLYLYITYSCNLYCKHCWIDCNSENKEFVDYQVLENILPDLIRMGLTSVSLTGGEPTLHPSILKILKLFHDQGISQFLTTNGMLLSDSFCKEISEYKKLRCSISLDGVVPSTHDDIRGVKGAFEKTVGAIKNLLKYNIPFEVIFCVQKRNINEIKDFIDFSKYLGIKRVRINILSYNGGIRIKYLKNNEGMIDIEKVLDIKSYIDTINKEKIIHIVTNLPFAFYKPFEIPSLKTKVCGIKQSIGILPNGYFSLCGVGKLKDELLFGHTEQGVIEKIWKENSIINFIRYGIPDRFEGICRFCIFNKLCCGSCIAQNYLENNNLFSSFLLCKILYEKKLFPQKYLISERR
jgi:SynChlorMet cassette radical SAM/SPASM protein ScmF